MNARELLLNWSARALWLAFGLLAVGVIGWIVTPTAFYQAWLMAWTYWFGISLGMLVLLLLQWLTGGAWGRAVRGPCEAAVPAIPVMALLFIPVAIGAGDLYPWMDRSLFEHHDWPHKAEYFQFPFFLGRAVLVFAILGVLAVLARRWSQNRRRWQDDLHQLRMRQVSCSGIILYFVCMNFASTDWIMSLDPGFFSTIFSTIVMVSQFLSALALVIAVLCGLSRLGPFSGLLSEKQFHDLGNLLLAFVVFWAYVSISQFLLIWSADLPHEISWYLDRRSGGWSWVALVLATLQFFIPFALLLSRAAKRNPVRLGWIAVLVAAANVLNVYWLIAPSLHPAGISINWLAPVLFAGIGAVWAAIFLRFWSGQPDILISREAAHV